MERTFESGIDDDAYNKLNEVYTKALYKGDFGDALDALNFEELKILMRISDNFIMDRNRVCAPGAFSKLIVGLRKGLNSIGEERIESVPEDEEIIHKLQRAIQVALDKFKPSNPEIQKPDQYMKNFLAYINLLDEKEKGPNATELKIKSYVIVGPKQVEPKDDQENKVVISYRMSFEENLAFIKEHINQAVTLNNLRETDARLRRKDDDY